MHLVDEGKLGEIVYSFEFNSSYYKPKPLDDFPALKEQKI
jgi:hypothetical protein